MPRRVVLTRKAVQVELGFAIGEAKYAFLQRAIEAVPAEPVSALRHEPQLTAAPAR